MHKKLLVLGGSILHYELVNTANAMGVETYVTDFLPIEKSPAKQIAAHAWNIDINDYDQLIEKCKSEKIDGVLNAYINPGQIPHMKICEALGLPRFGNEEQLEIFTNKKKFLDVCADSGIDIIPQYSEAEITPENDSIEYPIYVKPADSRGTRGQTICYNYSDFFKARDYARSESTNGEIVIEKFMSGAQDIQLTYFVIDGEPYLECAGDKYNGTVEEGHQGSVIFGLNPTVNGDVILRNAHPKICKMLKNIGLKNTPVFLQGFLDGDKLRLYDPALRLPGYLYELIMREAMGIDVYKALIQYSFMGTFPNYLKEVEQGRYLKGLFGVSLWIFLRAGKIKRIEGIDKLLSYKQILQVNQCYHEGDTIEDWNDIRNSSFEIAALCSTREDVKDIVDKAYKSIRVIDENDEDMKFVLFDTNRIRFCP